MIRERDVLPSGLSARKSTQRTREFDLNRLLKEMRLAGVAISWEGQAQG